MKNNLLIAILFLSFPLYSYSMTENKIYNCKFYATDIDDSFEESFLLGYDLDQVSLEHMFQGKMHRFNLSIEKDNESGNYKFQYVESIINEVAPNALQNWSYIEFIEGQELVSAGSNACHRNSSCWSIRCLVIK